MNTFKTIEGVRQAAKECDDHIHSVIEILHSSKSNVFIICKVSMKALQEAINQNPMTEITKLVKEHNVLTDAEIAELKDQSKKEYDQSVEKWHKDHTAKINNAMTLNGRSN